VGRVGILALDAVWMPALQLFQMEQVAPQWRPRAYGLQSMVMGGCFALVSLGGGVLSASAGYRSVFAVGVGLCAAGATVRWLAARRAQPGRDARYVVPSDAPRGAGAPRGARK
jgi:predicted MFS family arabinose efflux permease